MIIPELRIEIRHADGVEVFDPNRLIMAILTGRHRAWKPLPSSFSELNRQPAILYSSYSVTLELTVRQLERLVRLRLTPDEYMTLQMHHGIVFEWHEDFYDPNSGEALQPR